MCDPKRNKLLSEGSKGDKPDARRLAELLRVGMVRSVWHGHDRTRGLKLMVRAYETFTIDTKRTMLRIKAIYRGRGIAAGGSGVYQATQREQWLGQIPEAGMLAESRHHRAVALLRSIPQVGPIRAAQIVATADTPFRFRTKRQFWSYRGLAVVTHSSAEYDFQGGRVRRRSKPVATRGLNRNCNRRLKSVFVSAAVAGGQSDPWSEYLERLTDKGMRPEMARLTLAREDCNSCSNDLEEGRNVRSQETEHDTIAVFESAAG